MKFSPRKISLIISFVLLTIILLVIYDFNIFGVRDPDCKFDQREYVLETCPTPILGIDWICVYTCNN